MNFMINKVRMQNFLINIISSKNYYLFIGIIMNVAVGIVFYELYNELQL